jgi:predicted DNA-binding transcriptional regulator AlpA
MTLTADEVRALPAVLDLPTAAQVLGVGRTIAYELVRSGQWPTPVLRLGKLIRVPTAPLVDLLGLEATQPAYTPRDGLGSGGSS